MNQRRSPRLGSMRRCLSVVACCFLLLAATSIAVETASGTNVGVPKPPTSGIHAVSGFIARQAAAAGSSVAPLDSTRSVQERLAKLGYLGPSGVDGIEGPNTETALVAFQKWEGLPRTGVVDSRTRSALERAARPAPVGDEGKGRRVEILIDRQLLLAIQGDRVVRTVDVSTGKPSTPTPVGSFDVYAKYPRWWSTPFSEWLLWAAPFNGGVAIHQFPSVPTYAASHGCVRVPSGEAPWVYGFLSVDTPVRVLASSR
jgi:peptidoglycan hydrolase-like protein with peptidoglycan-binding domain